MRQLLGTAADWAVYGLVKRKSLAYGSPGSGSFTQEWVEMPHLRRVPHSPPLRELENRFVPDAFGLQLVSRDHATHAPKGESWSVTQLDHGSLLIEHTDIQAWYGGTLPKIEVLQAARSDFRNLLLTDSVPGVEED